jgi:hypothetical protein
MSRIRVVALWVFAALISFAVPAMADNDQGENNDDQGGRRPHQTHSAPEIDPVAAGAVLAVVVGGTTVLAARRARRKSDK